MVLPISESELLYQPRDVVRSFQLSRLRQTLHRVRQAPFFAPRFKDATVEALDDLARLPPTSKQDLRDASPFDSVAVPPTQLFQYHESFGTTGKPVASWLTRGDFEAYAQQINQSDLDFKPGDLLVNRFPYSISVPAHIIKLAAQNRGACVVSAGALTDVCPYVRTVELMHKLRASVLTCLPTEGVLLGAAARAIGLDPARDFNLRALGVAGELLTAARRRRLEAMWSCKVFNFYGTTETGNLASDCTAGRLHLAWDHFLLEVLDPDAFEARGEARVLPEGEMGLPAITTLTREAMPLIRYVLSDLVRLQYDHNCPCGRKAPIVVHLGRDLNRFPFRGRTVFLGDIEDRLFDLSPDVLGDIYLVLVTPDKVYFRVESARPDRELYRQAEQRVRDELSLPLEIEPVEPGGLFPHELLLQPARVGKPLSYWLGPSRDQAPEDLLSLWASAHSAPEEDANDSRSR